jgi:very-short-patch-repair endonuclease
VNRISAAEQTFADALREFWLPGWRICRQQMHVHTYWLDFALLDEQGRRLNIEIDGKAHRYQQYSDGLRDAFCSSVGFRVLRISDEDVFDDVRRCVVKTRRIFSLLAARTINEIDALDSVYREYLKKHGYACYSETETVIRDIYKKRKGVTK